jgi:hypothetical protein
MPPTAGQTEDLLAANFLENAVKRKLDFREPCACEPRI